MAVKWCRWCRWVGMRSLGVMALNEDEALLVNFSLLLVIINNRSSRLEANPHPWVPHTYLPTAHQTRSLTIRTESVYSQLGSRSHILLLLLLLLRLSAGRLLSSSALCRSLTRYRSGGKGLRSPPRLQRAVAVIDSGNGDDSSNEVGR
jgi:hypothetical protein